MVLHVIYLLFGHVQIDRFLQVLDATTQFIEIGEEFSQSGAHGLRTMLKKQSTNYFMAFHKERMEVRTKKIKIFVSRY